MLKLILWASIAIIVPKLIFVYVHVNKMLIVYQYFEIDSPVHKIAINAYALVTIWFLWKVDFFSLKMDSD